MRMSSNNRGGVIYRRSS